STISPLTTAESKEDALEAKLLQNRPSKRIRLCRAIENLPTDNTSCPNPATYLAAVRSTLISSSGTGTNRDSMRDFKEALRTYRESSTSNTADCLTNDNMECVQVLHNKLATIFASDKSKKLLTGLFRLTISLFLSHSYEYFSFNSIPLHPYGCTVTFSHSLAQHDPTPDGDCLLANYMKPETPGHLSLSVLKSNSSSIFDSIDNQPDESATSSTISPLTTAESKEDALEAKLLQNRPSKRIRLCRAIENLPTDNTSCPNPATYLAAVRSTLISSSGTGTNRDSMRDFKEALRTYRESSTSNTADCLTNDNMECVQVLHNKLATIFASDKSKKLLTGVTCFLLPAHRSYYAELCKQRTLLTTDQADCSSFLSDKGTSGKSSDNAIIKCSRCHGCPARTPLVSTCNHIACFGCWRAIIEDGNRRCPSCHCLVRRRNLTRLVVQPSTASKSADA
ncbi:hypothetical protein AHF37_04859, partial [Paragonimus kellicotti]